MLLKRMTAVVMLFVIMTAGIVLFLRASFSGSFPALSVRSIADRSYLAALETALAQAVPYNESMKSTLAKGRALLGRREQNDIFIAENTLIENLSEPNTSYVTNNTNSIIEFSYNYSVPVYVSIIPAKCAILQEKVPDFATLYNQRSLVEGIYTQMAANVLTGDVYPTLFEHRNDYIYYRTDPGLTGTGSYYAYRALAERLGLVPRALDQFDIQYIGADYYGRTYEQSDYKDVDADIVSVHHFVRHDREYIVRRQKPAPRIYNTLYPTHLAQLGSPLDVYLGGAAPRIDIQVGGGFDEKLLVFGDASALSIVPFLAPDYGEITVADLSLLTNSEIAKIDPEAYDQVLFLYAIETYIHTDTPARITWLQ